MTDNIQTVFISGANRGIGFELARQLVKQPYQVIAGYRDESRSKELLGEAERTRDLYSVQVDVTSENDLADLYKFIDNRFGYLDVLINNAGINLNRSLTTNELAWSDLAHHFEVNVGSAFLTSKYLYPLLRVGSQKMILNISSNLGSIELNNGGSMPYSVSKAGLNMLTKHQSIDYREDDITVVCISPGWVKTDMGGSAAPLTVEESVLQIVRLLDTVMPSQSGQFLDLSSNILPY